MTTIRLNVQYPRPLTYSFPHARFALRLIRVTVTYYIKRIPGGTEGFGCVGERLKYEKKKTAVCTEKRFNCLFRNLIA